MCGNNHQKMTHRFFSASMMCADYGHLEKEIHDLESAGIDSFHVDIMDGHFVHNFAMGLYELAYICRTAKKSVECHLMITDPYYYIGTFAKIGVDVVYVHPESEYQTSATIEKIISSGMTPGIAINPDTPAESITELLRIVDRVLVMCVNPGNAGQIYLPFVHDKICKLLAMRDEYNFEVYWDGHGSVENIMKYAPLGVNGFVLGTAALFGKGRPYGEILSELRYYSATTPFLPGSEPAVGYWPPHVASSTLRGPKPPAEPDLNKTVAASE